MTSAPGLPVPTRGKVRALTHERSGMTTIKDVMTTNLCSLPTEAPVMEAARMMRDEGVGDILVVDAEGRLQGIATDRDITVRAIAEGLDPQAATISQICSPGPLTTIAPDDDVDDAVAAVRDAAVKRVPVLDEGRPVGIVSIGDLAIERDPDSALADMSAEPPNT